MDEKIITIEKVVFGGKGLSRDLEKVTFVRYTLPGEKVRIRGKKEYRDYFEAEAIEIVEPSPDRVPPDCRYFGSCGGCQMSHGTYAAQIRIKEASLKESLARAHVHCPDIAIITADPLHYRHRARLKYDAIHNRLGFYEMESNQIVSIEECLCLTPGLNRLLKLLQISFAGAGLRPAHKGRHRQITEIECYENEAGETAVYFNAPLPPETKKKLQGKTQIIELADFEHNSLTVRFRDYSFPMRPDVFLQVNPKLWKDMLLELENHHQKSESVAVELYCGSGFFTLPLSRRFGKIHACEENPGAIRFAKEHSREKNIEWHCTKAEDFPFPPATSVLIVDPPRSGLHKTVINRMLNHPVDRISYVSCDCAAFARDVKNLSSIYELTRLTLLDLFPQTFHFETIALLQKRP